MENSLLPVKKLYLLSHVSFLSPHLYVNNVHSSGGRFNLTQMLLIINHPQEPIEIGSFASSDRLSVGALGQTSGMLFHY